MHLKFASRLQARKALARNGRLLTDTLMIGVVPCTYVVSIYSVSTYNRYNDSIKSSYFFLFVQSIAEEMYRKENTLPINTPASMRVTSTPQTQMRDRSSTSFSLATSMTTPTLDRSNLRPLTQVFKGAQADYEVFFIYSSFLLIDLHKCKLIFFFKVAQPRGTPQQNTSMVSKAMEFVFGW